MSDQCIENWTKKGWCHCDTCNAYGDALMALGDVKRHQSREDWIAFISKEAGHSLELSEQHVDIFMDLGVLVETCEGSGIFGS